MIPRDEILKQVNRFYDLLEKIDSKIEQSKENPNFVLLESYFLLSSKIGTKLMYSIDDIKTELDSIEEKIDKI